jgi:hypothetical protein
MSVVKGPDNAGISGGRLRGPVRLRRYAIDQAVAVAQNPSIDPQTRDKIIQQISDIATGPSVYGRLVYRMIAVALGLVAVLAVVFAFVLLLNKHTVDAAFYTLGSAAVGALGGVFAPGGGTGQGAATPGGAGGQGAATPGGAGGQGAATPGGAGGQGAAGG